jgi:hypothetical protein
VGKTTTKDLVAAVLGTLGPTLKTEGNLNNHWGVPLTLLRLGGEHVAAVIEMGSNHPGEIALLAALARPNRAVITGAGSAHLEHFGSLEAIANEKASLAAALGPAETLFVSADSPALLAALKGALPPRDLRRRAAPACGRARSSPGRRHADRVDTPFRARDRRPPPRCDALAALAVARGPAWIPRRRCARRGIARRTGAWVQRAHGAAAGGYYNANPESTAAAPSPGRMALRAAASRCSATCSRGPKARTSTAPPPARAPRGVAGGRPRRTTRGASRRAFRSACSAMAAARRVRESSRPASSCCSRRRAARLSGCSRLGAGG